MKKLFTFFMSTALFGMVFGQCHYVIDMQDSYGDGWNGASVDVSVNGTVLANWGLGSGSSGSDSLSTFAGDAIEFIFNPGSWDGEITFQITDPAGNSLGNFGPNPATGMFLSHTSNATCASSYNVTFQLNTSSIISGGGSIASTIYVGGGVVGDAMALALADPDNDGIYEGTTSFPAGGGNYVFLNSPNSGGDWGAKENLSGLPCADAANYDDRLMPAISQDTTIQACFGTCDSDGTCASFIANSNITFVVDMNNVTDPFTLAQVAGSWNNWSAPSDLSDADGDGVWEGTVSIQSGSSIEYKFLADNWNIQEMNDPAASCTNGDPVYTNRTYTVPSADASIPVVCWASCSPCPIVSGLTITAVWDLSVPAAGNSILCRPVCIFGAVTFAFLQGGSAIALVQTPEIPQTPKTGST